MFLGTYTPKLDDKGRLTLPAKFRDALAGGLMVTKSQDHSLAVYPRAEFEAMIIEKNERASRGNPEARAYLRNLAAATDEQHPDAQGRITLSADHRRYANLSKECVGDRLHRLPGDLGRPGLAGLPERPRRELLSGLR